MSPENYQTFQYFYSRFAELDEAGNKIEDQSLREVYRQRLTEAVGWFGQGLRNHDGWLEDCQDVQCRTFADETGRSPDKAADGGAPRRKL
jgi:hypothetical protein